MIGTDIVKPLWQRVALRVDQLQFVAINNDQFRIAFGAKTYPIDVVGKWQGAVGLNGDFKSCIL